MTDSACSKLYGLNSLMKVLLKHWIGSSIENNMRVTACFLDEANSNMQCIRIQDAVLIQFSFNYHVSVQISCGLWGWYPVSSWVNWPWKECLYHTDEETPFPTLSCYSHPQRHMKGRTMAPRKEEKVSIHSVWFKYAHITFTLRMIIDPWKSQD